MSLLLIVLLLDKSHLELVEDVLKETNFNDEDWFELGRELGVYFVKQKNLYPAEDSLMLKDCLRRWLSANYCNPILNDLAVALVRIGYEAGEYIIKACKLIIMFNDQCYQYTEVIVISRLL